METKVLVTTAVSGGSLRRLLQEAVARHGAERIAVGVERVAMDFPLPCPSGVGTPLNPEALSLLRRRGGGRVFFSEPLCAKYFTYDAAAYLKRSGQPQSQASRFPPADGGRVSKHAEPHFVLFDDEETLRQKIALARSLGISDIFLLYPGRLDEQ